MKNFLNSKWLSFVCAAINLFVAAQCYALENWGLCVLCSAFTLVCGYNFWTQTGEE
jgi:hypothetical protein